MFVAGRYSVSGYLVRSVSLLCAAAAQMTRQVLSMLALSACCSAASPPNIVFIFSDDHAYQAISAYGSKLTTTPHIDRIARDGMRFDRCYVTNSICGPRRACILTGKCSHKNGYYLNDQEFDGSKQTFPKLLQQAGYQTALVGKWHLGFESLPTGFDHWNILWHQGYYYQPKFINAYYLGQGHNVAEHYGVTNGKLKLIHFYKLDERELFDLESDPHEMHSVYGDTKYAEQHTAMLAELQRLRTGLEVTSDDPPHGNAVKDFR
jgi:arylsulfatase A-like enzyme